MAQYNEDAKLLADIIKDKNALKSQIAGSTQIYQILKQFTPAINVDVENVIVQTRTVVGGFILDDPVRSVLDSTALADDSTAFSSYTEVYRMKWFYTNATELATGTKSANIKISNGDIRIS